MLSSPNRLRKAHEITRVYKKGAYGSAEGLISVKAVKSGHAVSRAVVVVGKKVDKRAVVRNTIRRRLAAALATIWGTVPPGYDIVVSVHADVSDQSAPKLQSLLSSALARAHVLAD